MKQFTIEVRWRDWLLAPTAWTHWKSYATTKDRAKALETLRRKDRNPKREFRAASH